MPALQRITLRTRSCNNPVLKPVLAQHTVGWAVTVMAINTVASFLWLGACCACCHTKLVRFGWSQGLPTEVLRPPAYGQDRASVGPERAGVVLALSCYSGCLMLDPSPASVPPCDAGVCATVRCDALRLARSPIVHHSMSQCLRPAAVWSSTVV